MRDFSFYIEDDRYKVASLRLVTARDAPRARMLALRCLTDSPHHLAVEVCEEERLLFKVTREEADRTVAC
jgi:hypothetical protein